MMVIGARVLGSCFRVSSRAGSFYSRKQLLQVSGGRAADDDHEPEYRNQGRRQSAPASEHGRQPIENRIKRDGQHDAPDDDRYERTYENEGPVGEEADKSEVNRQFDESRVELTIIERFCALFGH